MYFTVFRGALPTCAEERKNFRNLVLSYAYLGSKGACRMRERIRLAEVTDDKRLTQETDPAFWSMLQRAVLLGLKEQGILSEEQYRHAAEIQKGKGKNTL